MVVLMFNKEQQKTPAKWKEFGCVECSCFKTVARIPKEKLLAVQYKWMSLLIRREKSIEGVLIMKNLLLAPWHLLPSFLKFLFAK